MATIALRTETALRYQQVLRERAREIGNSITDSISQAVVHTSHNLDCSAIITATESGYTARMVSKYRPKSPIIAVTPNEEVLRKLTLVWGVYPVIGAKAMTTDEMFQTAVSSALTNKFVDQGDLVIITAGVPVCQSGTTNLMKVHVMGGVLAQGQGIGKKVVTGPVVVGTSAEEIRNKMMDGAIIVTLSTDKDMIDCFERAGAVITEEGGLTSHAAVVGVSLSIPVIVGVENATTVLRNEELITIDTERGHIYSGRANVL
jgi:pyruvate kinase